jgi:hypothetical protein
MNLLESPFARLARLTEKYLNFEKEHFLFEEIRGDMMASW